MIIGEIIKVAFQSIRANKLRAILTMLGVIIGVGAVIAVVALGTGAQRAVEARIEAMGAQLLTISPGQSFMGGRASEVRVSLTVADADALRDQGRGLAAVVPEIQRSFQVKYGAKNFNINILGTTPNYVPVRNYEVVVGRNLTEGDDGGRQRYALLGADIPKMFGVNPISLINQTIQIRGQPFEIVGILSAKGSQGWSNPDEQIIVPLSTARYRLMGSDRLRNVAVKVADGVPLERGMVEVEQILRSQHKIRPGGANDFQIMNPQEILQTQQETTETFGLLLTSIAAVSLIVGGIGIMNIMLVSVTERTREIGIRKALGATKFNILFQFLTEAVTLCMLGGILGIGAGAWGAAAMSKYLGWSTVVSPVAVGVAFAFSVAVGLFFGLWPAKRAAGLNTIDALRYE
ncbi:MAG: ABC transporter permease [Gemmatimonadota bacterium]|nr:ABC transporter permease [Gemmatimonadota bacterium]